MGMTGPRRMFTVLEDPENYARGFSTGADAYLAKGCPPNELLMTIERFLNAEHSLPGLPSEIAA